jgi:hypothetical protein
VYISGTFHIISSAVIGSHAPDTPQWRGYIVARPRHSSVGKHLYYGLNDQGICAGFRLKRKKPSLDPTEPHVPRILQLFLVGVKRQERGAAHSPKLVLRLKMVELYLHASYVFLVCPKFIKHRDHFTAFYPFAPSQLYGEQPRTFIQIPRY